ncbi:MAG: YigZ family protein [Motiliproteus sp.]
MPAPDPSNAIGHAYSVAQAPVEVEIVIKKSRFIARAAFAADREQAMQWLAQAKTDYPDARHHCWAYLLGPPQAPRSQAFADDGEPGGTAGKPILNVLQHKHVGDLMLIVIRYFGGIKLGAGGLVRAYGQAAQAAIEQLSCRVLQPQQQIRVSCDFAQEQYLRHWFGSHEGTITAVDYAEAVSILVSMASAELPRWHTEAARLGLSYQMLDSALS